MFSFLLSFIIALYNFILLTPIVSIAGINNIFCKSKPNMQNRILLPTPIVNVIDEIVYPMQNPLNKIKPKTTGIPMIVVPASHIIIAKIMFFFIDSANNSPFYILSIDLNFSINSVIYDVIVSSCSSVQLFINITPYKYTYYKYY